MIRLSDLMIIANFKNLYIIKNYKIFTNCKFCICGFCPTTYRLHYLCFTSRSKQPSPELYLGSKRFNSSHNLEKTLDYIRKSLFCERAWWTIQRLDASVRPSLPDKTINTSCTALRIYKSFILYVIMTFTVSIKFH